ncbi:hypothetical protein PLESTM_001479600 [Pleodorina starrii]|nr:hypothetical protein PLESTM_001479600 [Pleodorina starrii]
MAYAPVSVDGGNWPERVLLVLGCTHSGCGSDARSWRAFRCQLAPSTGKAAAERTDDVQFGCPVSAKVESAAGPPEPAAPPQVLPAADPFGGGFDSAEGGDFFCGDSSGLDFSDIAAALNDCATKQLQQQQHHQQQAASARSKHQRDAVDAAGCTGEEPAEGVGALVPSAELPLTGPPLPEFHIIAVEEPTGRRDMMRQGDEDHVRQLLEEYERQEQQLGLARGSLSNHASVPTGPAGSSQRGQVAACSMAAAGRSPAGGRGSEEGSEDGAAAGVPPPGDGGDDMDSWAGEEYEEDHVRGVQGAYLKYSARLTRQPDQCARYSRGGDVLWPLQEAPQPPPCASCGAPRVFELQLTAPLLAMVLECADWLQGPDLEKHWPAINAAANWDFTTLAVYTCSANCHAASSGAPVQEGAVLLEEYVAVVSEEECHVPEELKLAK